MDKKKNTIHIEYFNGTSKDIKLSQDIIEELNKQQLEQFEKMKRDIRTGKIHFFDKTLYVVSQGFTLCTGEITGLASISLFVALGVPQAVSMLGLTVCLYTTSGIMHFMSPIHEKKLTKQIKITDFIVNYRDAVTKIIREEVDKRRKSILNCQNIYTTYPGDVPYTQTLYEQGLNLSTMDELSLKQQKQLRKIIKTRI